MCAAFGSFHCLFYRFFQLFFQLAGFEFIFGHIRVSHHELYLECNEGGNAEGKDSPSPPGRGREGTHFDSHVLRRPRYLFWPVFSLLFSSFSPRFSKRVPFFSRCSPRLSFRSPFLSSFSPALTLP